MDRPSSLTRRRLLGAAGVGALSAMAGCQTGDDGGGSEPTVTPAPVPADEAISGPLVVRYGAAGGSGPTTEAMTGLIESFAEDRGSMRVFTQPRSAPPPESGRSVVAFGRLGAAMVDRAERGELVPLETLWESLSGRVPNGLVQTSYLTRDLVAVPQAVTRQNTLFYNPSVLAAAGVGVETYATVSDLADEPGPLAAEVETLFGTPLGSLRDRVALFESVLSSRLVSQRQFDQLRSGTAERNRLMLARAVGDYASALSLLPPGEGDISTSELLDGVLEGRIGFARLSSRAVTALIRREDAVYGEDWAVAPMFSSPWTVVADVEGFVIPQSTAALGRSRSFLRFATGTEPQRQFGARGGWVPARTDAASAVDHHPAARALATHYERATIHAPSLSRDIAVRQSVRNRLANTLEALEYHGSTETATDGVVTAFEDTAML